MFEVNTLHNCDCSAIMSEILQDKTRKYCVVTDPPFNIGYHYKTYKDKMDADEYYKWLAGIVGDCCAVVHYPESLYRLAIEKQAPPQRVVSWVYNSNTPRQHRDIAFWGVKPDFSKVLQPYKNPTDKRIKARMAAGIGGGKMYDWFNVNQVKGNSKQKKHCSHPCTMPYEVMRRIVGVIPEDYVIVDPFMGTGTTILAAKMLDRDYIGIELDKEYFDFAKERLNFLL
jgi:DNA modification methylase